MEQKKFPTSITSYDLFKTFAILTMVLDHVGYYFFPDDMWWRAAGRLSAPVWLFLIGYARSRDLSPKLWVGAGALILASGVFGPEMLPSNILVNILFIRLVLDRVMARIFSKLSNFLELALLGIVLAVPSFFITDYGLVGLVIAIFAAIMRQRLDRGVPSQDIAFFAGVAAFILYYGQTMLTFGFDGTQNIVTAGACVLVFIALFNFKPVEYAGLTQRLPHFVTLFLQFCGRYTFEIYVAHLLVFKIASCVLATHGDTFFSFRLIEPH
jgi:hypothetical protein